MKPLQLDFDVLNEQELEVCENYKDLYHHLVEDLNITPKIVVACPFTEENFEVRIYNNEQHLAFRKEYSYLIEPNYNSEITVQNNNVNPSKKENRIQLKPVERKRVIGLKNRS